MSGAVKTSFWVLLFALSAGICLALFTQIEDFVKYLFSLLALFIGFRFFRRFETIGMRVLFIALALFFCFLTILCFAVYQFAQQNPEYLTGML